MAKSEHHMTELPGQEKGHQKPPRSMPPGGIRIDQAFRQLLTTKNYSDITIEDIVNVSGVNSALIYKYYGDKRGLFFQVLNEGLDRFHAQLEHELKGIKGALNKLRKIAWFHVNLFNENRAPARLMLMEVRSHHSFFHSAPYEKIRRYFTIVSKVVREGVEEGVIRKDIPVTVICQVFMGSIEHLCLPWLISGEDISSDDIAESLCNVLFCGIEPPKSTGGK